MCFYLLTPSGIYQSEAGKDALYTGKARNQALYEDMLRLMDIVQQQVAKY